MINIMLVEDDEVDAIAVKRMFRKNHVINPLYLAGNGLEALAVLHERHSRLPASKENLLILLDLYMPKMNGLEFLAELQLNRDFRKIPVIVFLTSDAMKTRIENYELNIVGYLSKPFIFSELTEIVKCDFADSINRICDFSMLPA